MSTLEDLLIERRNLVTYASELSDQVEDMRARLSKAADKAEALRTLATGVTMVSSAGVLKVLDDPRYLT